MPPRKAGRRQHVGAAFLVGGGREESIGFLANGLRHATGLAVGPDDAPVLEVQPVPLQRADLGTAGSELELKADRQPTLKGVVR